MKSEHRHQLQQNELAARLERAVEWSKRNAQLLAGVVVGGLLVLGIFFYLRNRWEQSVTAGWTDFYSASEGGDSMRLEALAGRELDELPGQLAALTLADGAFVNGQNQMNTDRAEAEKQLNAAKNRFASVRTIAKDPLVKRRATLGLAQYYEAVGLLDEAVKEYEQLASDKSDAVYAAVAKRKLALIKEPSTQQFAAWYREHKPLPPGGGAFGGDDFMKNLHSLPPDEKSFPSTTPAADATPAATTPAASSPSATVVPAPSATPAAAATPAASATATGTAK